MTIAGDVNNFTQPDSNSIKAIKPSLIKGLLQADSFDVQQWQRYIEQEIGFVLPNVQLQWLINAIEHTALSHGLTVEKLWCQLSKNDEVRQQLLDKVLIHESRFFVICLLSSLSQSVHYSISASSLLPLVLIVVTTMMLMIYFAFGVLAVPVGKKHGHWR